MIIRGLFGEALDVHLPHPIDTDGEPVAALVTGDIKITEDDLTGIADTVDADDGDLGAFDLDDGIRFQLSVAEMSPPVLLDGTRTIRVMDQPAGTAFISEDHIVITTDSHLAKEPNGCIWASKGDASGQTTTNIVLGVDDEAEQPTDAGIVIPVGAYFEVTSGTHAGARGYVKAYAANAITPYEALAAALDNTDFVRVYRDATAPARVTVKESTVALSAQEALDVTAAVPTAAQIQAELEENGASVLDTLSDRLTAARATNLDEITAARLAELDQANLPADVAAVATAVGDVPTNAELATALAAADDAVLAAITLVLADTATILSRATEARLAELDAGNLPTDVSAATIRTAVGLAAANLDTQLAALDTLIDSVIAAVVTASGEPGQGAPPVSAALATKVAYLYKWARNASVQTPTEQKFFADDGVTVDQKRSASEAALVFTVGEISAGP